MPAWSLDGKKVKSAGVLPKVAPKPLDEDPGALTPMPEIAEPPGHEPVAPPKKPLKPRPRTKD